MAEEWFCSIAGKVSGPLSPQQLREMTTKGYLSPSDLVRLGAGGAWFPAGRIKGLFPAGALPGDSAGQPAGSASGAPVPVAKPLQPPPQGPSSASRPPAPPPVTAAAIPVPPVPAPNAPPIDLAFLDQEPAAPPKAAARTRIATPELTDRKEKRRKQMLMVWALVAVLAGLSAVAIAVQVWVRHFKPGAPKLEQVAKLEEQTRPKAKDPEAVVGLSEKALESLQLPGAKEAGKGSGKAEKAAAALDAGPWVDARSPASVGQIEVKVRSLTLGRPSWLRVSGRGAKSQYLVLTLELANASKDRKVDHAGWGPGTAVRLADDRQPPNTYALKFAYAGREGPEAIYPGESIEDRLVFDKPVEAAKRLRLQLPAAAFGGTGTVKFEIPMEMVTRAEEAEDPQPRTAPKAAAVAKTEQAAPAARAPQTMDAPTEGPTGDPSEDFGISRDAKEFDRPAGVLEAERNDAERGKAASGRKAPKAAPKRKAPEGDEADGQESGFERATRKKARF